jgi:FixJ family two-component response regulator
MSSEATETVSFAREPTLTLLPLEIGVVDDDPSVLRALRLFLEVAGFKVGTFSSAEEFLVSVCLERARCLVVDVQLGGMSGFDLSDYLAATEHRIPLIFITAHDSEQTRERAKRAGAVAYLLKPFDEDALIRAIHSALGGALP